MDCPHCHSVETTKLQRKTALGYDVFRCQDCDCTFNERTGTPFNYIEEVVTDGHTSYPRAIAEMLGPEAAHHQVDCVANPIEQDHRGIKKRSSDAGFQPL